MQVGVVRVPVRGGEVGAEEVRGEVLHGWRCEDGQRGLGRVLTNWLGAAGARM